MLKASCCHNIKYDKNCYTNLSDWKRSLDCLPIYVQGRYSLLPTSLFLYFLEEDIKLNVLELTMSSMLTVSERAPPDNLRQKLE